MRKRTHVWILKEFVDGTYWDYVINIRQDPPELVWFYTREQARNWKWAVRLEDKKLRIEKITIRTAKKINEGLDSVLYITA
jgi:hypothetical protein